MAAKSTSVATSRQTKPAPSIKRNVGNSTNDSPEFFSEIEQGSQEWIDIRLGLPTASMFGTIMSEARDPETGGTRAEYMRRLAGELLTGEVAEEKFKSKAMERGNLMEPEARDDFARRNLYELEQVGFVRRRLPSGRYVGASPDSLFEKRRCGLEIKTMRPDLMIARLESGAGMPSGHRWQVYGTMWVCGLESVVLKLFYRGMPVSPEYQVNRDEKVIKEISDAVEVFDHQLTQLVKKIRAMGTPR